MPFNLTHFQQMSIENCFIVFNTSQTEAHSSIYFRDKNIKYLSGEIFSLCFIREDRWREGLNLRLSIYFSMFVFPSRIISFSLPYSLLHLLTNTFLYERSDKCENRNVQTKSKKKEKSSWLIMLLCHSIFSSKFTRNFSIFTMPSFVAKYSV